MLRRLTGLFAVLMFAGVLALVCAPAVARAENLDATESVDVEVGDDPEPGDDPELPHEPGWAFEDDVWRYYEDDGTLRTDAWLNEDDLWYYFDADGTSVADAWVKWGGKWYYLGPERTAVTDDWVRYDNSWYYLKSNGTPLVNGWQQYEDAWYYFGADGKLARNSWVHYGDKYYYLGANGQPLVAQQIKYKDTYYYFGADGYCTASSTSKFGTSLKSVVNACRTTPTTGNHRCAAWVTYVFMNAGIGHFIGNADEMCDMWCTSSKLEDLKPGMIIAVTSTSGSYESLRYGHVGIYVGNGIVAHNNEGVVGTMTLYDWWVEFGDLMTPRWGWLGGIVLS